MSFLFAANLHRLLRPGEGQEPDDGQLLDSFLGAGDESAFAELLRRHGPMVLGVCRRILGNETDADDAFQATFLVLVRKAEEVRPRSRVGAWLHGVAFNIARKARATIGRRRRMERQSAESRARQTSDAEQLSETLDRELGRLPEKYRLPILLCDLEGHSLKDAARLLGWPEGTVSSRLSRGRETLAGRLRRHGMAGSVPAAGCLPPATLAATLRLASLLARGQAAGLLPARVAVLVEAMMKTMLLNRLKTAGLALLLTLSVGLATLALAMPDQKSTRPTKPTGLTKPVTDRDRLQGVWKVVEMETQGEKLEKEFMGYLAREMIFRGDQLMVLARYQLRDGLFKLDPRAKPTTLDVVFGNGQFAGWKCIYALDGDELKVCFNYRDRPTDFQTKTTSSTLIKLRRDKTKTGNEPQTEKERIHLARLRTGGNLTSIGMAIHDYHDTYDRLPAHAMYSKAGKPLLSWRVEILPQLGYPQLYRQFKLDEPWDSEHNKKLLERMPKEFAPPAGVKTKTPYSTFLQAFVGPGTVFEPKVKVTLVGIPDGTSNTILVAEGGKAVPWTKPEDLPYDASKALPRLGGTFADGKFNLLMADGAVAILKIPGPNREPDLRTAITRADGMPTNLEGLYTDD